jgi:hypothetical protein
MSEGRASCAALGRAVASAASALGVAPWALRVSPEARMAIGVTRATHRTVPPRYERDTVEAPGEGEEAFVDCVTEPWQH